MNTRPKAALHLCRIASPIGRIELTSNGNAITSLSIERAGRLPLEHLPERPDRVLARCVRQLDRYFGGVKASFTVPLELGGTPFQRAVWARLSRLGWGEVTSYGQIGMAIGGTPSGRAVGSAVRANPAPLLIPCHRVLAAGGKITGYSQGSGIATKVWLLDHEGIIHTQLLGEVALEA